MKLSIDFSAFCLNKITNLASGRNALQQIIWIATAYTSLHMDYVYITSWTDYNMWVLKNIQSFLQRKHKRNCYGGMQAGRLCSHSKLLHSTRHFSSWPPKYTAHFTHSTHQVLQIRLANYLPLFAQRLSIWCKTQVRPQKPNSSGSKILNW